MRNAAVIGQFERRLVELDCPAARLQHQVRELADHHEDLKRSALEEGMSDADAEAWAGARLGEPVTLAEQAAAVLRQSSWWGRHRVLGFCLLPPFVLSLMVGVALSLDFVFGRLYFPPAIFSVLADQPPDLKFLVFALVDTTYVAMALTALMFCGLARRSAAGLRCKLAACAMCALYACGARLTVEPHSLSYSWNFPPGLPRDWIPVVIPLVVAVAAVIRHRWRLNHIAPIPVPGPPGSRFIRPRPALPRTGWNTPTTAITLLGVFALFSLVRFVWTDIQNHQARHEELTGKIWPAERAAVMEQLSNHPPVPGFDRAVTINLRPFANSALADSLAGRSATNGNNLVQLPEGTHVFAGVPFEVEGRVQLLGRGLLNSAPTLPLAVRNIPIARQCEGIFLLHGAAGIKPEMAGANVAKLVVHYADGSRATLMIAAGRDVLDWRGPIYRTDAGREGAGPSSVGTELAWAGSNPELAREDSDDSLRLYRTVFRNPYPEREIATVDYVSTASDAAPFLLGLTVE